MGFDVVLVASWNADLVSRVPRPVARGAVAALLKQTAL